MSDVCGRCLVRDHAHCSDSFVRVLAGDAVWCRCRETSPGFHRDVELKARGKVAG